MKTKKLLNSLSKWTWARLRVVNFKLAGNLRWGFYREYDINDIPTLIKEFAHFTQEDKPLPSDNNSTVKATTFRAGSNYAILARLCEQYYIYKGSDKFKKKIFDEIDEIIEELRNDEQAAQEFETTLNALHNNVMQDFREAYPSFKEKDYQLYAFLVAGFTATTIAVLSNKEKSIIYNRISRLKRSIQETNPVACERFMAILRQN